MENVEVSANEVVNAKADMGELPANVEAKAEDKKFSYRGKVVELKDLSGPVAVQLDSNEVPAISGYGGYAGKIGGGKMPRLCVVCKVDPGPYGDKSRLVRFAGYKNDFKNGNVYAPSDFKVKVLSGRMGREIMSSYNEHRMKSLAQHLNVPMTIGSDPEVFVEDADNNNTIVPAFEFLGSKHSPNHKGEWGSAYWDGYQCEISFSRAGHCLAHHMDDIRDGLKTILEAAKKYNKTARLSTQTAPMIDFERIQNDAIEYVEFGCAPSFNIYGHEMPSIPPREVPFRPAGGHIHLGVGKRSDAEVREIVRVLDAILGVASVSLFAKFDDPIRRQGMGGGGYGQAGQHRTPKHGIEWRVLSSSILLSPVILDLNFSLARKCAAFAISGLGDVWKATEKEVCDTIDKCDVARAREIMTRNKDTFVKIANTIWPKHGETVFNVFMNGADAMLKDPTDIAKNWKLEGAWKAHADGNKAMFAAHADELAAGKKI